MTSADAVGLARVELTSSRVLKPTQEWSQEPKKFGRRVSLVRMDRQKTIYDENVGPLRRCSKWGDGTVTMLSGRRPAPRGLFTGTRIAFTVWYELWQCRVLAGLGSVFGPTRVRRTLSRV